MQQRLPKAMLIAAIVLAPAAEAGLWFSEQPPDPSLARDMKRSHGGHVLIEDDVYVKRLWLRKGEAFGDAAYLEPVSPAFQVLDTKRQLSTPEIANAGGYSAIRFKMPDEGYYNAYYSERSVADGVLHVDTAKAEVLKHNCRLGHNYDRALVQPNAWPDAPLEIVRLRLPEEDFHSHIRSGNLLKFSVTRQGKPLAGAKVRLETQKGWANTTRTGADGIATFQVIQDNFPVEEDEGSRFTGKTAAAGQADESRRADNTQTQAGGESNKRGKWQAKAEQGEHSAEGNSRWGGERHEDQFLVTAEYLADEAGQYQGQAYRRAAYSATMTGSYAPNIQVSQSKSLGLIYASAGFMTLGVGATVYRRRRIKPFKEVGFDER